MRETQFEPDLGHTGHDGADLHTVTEKRFDAAAALQLNRGFSLEGAAYLQLNRGQRSPAALKSRANRYLPKPNVGPSISNETGRGRGRSRWTPIIAIATPKPRTEFRLHSVRGLNTPIRDLSAVTLQLNRGESLKDMGRNPRFECGATRRIPSVSTDPESRGELIRAAFAMGVATLVDEAFIDYAPEESLSRTAAKLHGLVVLHTLTKTFAIPGLRVAYAVAHPEIRAAMESCIPAWSVDSVAADAARLLLADCASIAAARNANPRERNWLANALNSLGLEVFSSKANFLLVIQGLRPAKSHENASLSEIDFSMVSDDFRPCENRKGARGS